MAHQHYCDVGGHIYRCSSPECRCICDSPSEKGNHLDCPIELRACPEHEHGITSAELEVVQDPGAVPIEFPAVMLENLSLSNDDSKTYVGFCLWCGHGYEQYSPVLEAEHFAYHCPNAPDEHRANAKKRLSNRITTSRSR